MDKKAKWIPNLGFFVIVLIILFAVAILPFRPIVLSWVMILILGYFAIGALINQLFFYYQRRNSKIARRERDLRILASLMGFFLVTGMVLYLYAFQCEANDSLPNKQYLFINAEYLLHSFVCSLDLFMLDIDSNVLDNISGHDILKGLISVQAVLSFSCTAALLISLVYARIRAFYKFHKQTIIDNDHNHLYLFFGLNDPTRLLAKSIRAKEGDRALIIIVEKSPVDDEDRGGWNSIVEMFTHKEQTFSEAEELGARVTFTETRLCDIDKDKLSQKDILGEINLIKLSLFIRQLSSNIADAQLHVFFLSENEDNNIRAMSTLSEDESINFGVGKIKQRFYCHARKNGINRAIEDIAIKRGLEVRVIDSAHLAIELLKADEANHPVHFVEIDKENPTTVKSKFSSLVVGFDEAGQDAVRFLYEFGAFVDSRATPEKEFRSPFHCVAIDSKMSELNGVFKTFAPAAFKQINQDGSKLLELRQCDCNGERFYSSILSEIVQELNYVVIAVGDDEQGMLLAVRIFNYVRRERNDLHNFRIYVRSYDSDKEVFIQKIAQHYNQGYNTDLGKKEGDKMEEIIIPFGQIDKIYSFDTIVAEQFTLKGKKFQERYAQMRGDKPWDLRHELMLGIKKEVKDEYGNKTIIDVPLEQRKPSLNNIRKLRRQESQDLANALHSKTKMYLLKQTKPADFDWQRFYDQYFDADGVTPRCEGEFDGIHYPKLSPEENQAILNLARLEHLRWNASHELLGYEKASDDLHECDEQSRKHNCLRPWEELDAESMAVRNEQHWEANYKSFDFGVIDVSLLVDKDYLVKP
jgi:hypothetical protein